MVDPVVRWVQSTYILRATLNATKFEKKIKGFTYPGSIRSIKGGGGQWGPKGPWGGP